MTTTTTMTAGVKNMRAMSPFQCSTTARTTADKRGCLLFRGRVSSLGSSRGATVLHRKMLQQCYETSFCRFSRARPVRLSASLDESRGGGGEGEEGRAQSQTETETDSTADVVVDIDDEEWQRVRGLAERSMFAACTALLYLIGFSFRLEGYMGYLLPLPIILMGVRHGVKSSWNTLALISILQTVLFGPVRAASFICTHGFYSAALATFWSWPRTARKRSSRAWLAIVLGTSLARAVGLVGTIFLASFTLGDNVFALILNGIETLFEQAFSILGLPYLQFPLPRGLLAGTLFTLCILTSCLYVSLIYVMHASVLYKMGYTVPVPRFLERRLQQSRVSTAF